MTALTRRGLVTGALASLGAAAVPARARAFSRIGPDRLWIQRWDTGEVLNDTFIYRSEIAQRASWALYSHFWRDVKDRGQMVWIDRALLVVLSDLQIGIARATGAEKPLKLVSGYRTRQRNARLEGAASNSQHVHGRACDLNVPGVSPRSVADLAERIPGVGGVGRYPSFTHVDTGPRGRRWGTSR